MVSTRISGTRGSWRARASGVHPVVARGDYCMSADCAAARRYGRARRVASKRFLVLRLLELAQARPLYKDATHGERQQDYLDT
jgi:hypothetical protein